MSPRFVLDGRETGVVRRDFLAGLAGTAAAMGLGSLALAAETKKPAGRGPFVGIHIPAHSFYDEGVEQCLDFLQETAAVNTLFVTCHYYYGAIGRPLAVLGDHGVPKRDNAKRTLARIYVKHDDQYFRRTPLRHPLADPAAEYAGREIYADLAEPARKRGIKLYERLYEPSGDAKTYAIAGFDKVQTVDLYNKRGGRGCYNHPDYREFMAATVKSLFSAYPLDGLQFGAERPSPLSRMLQRRESSGCFCEFCRRRAKDAGVDPQRAQDGYQAIDKLFVAITKGEAKLTDGAAVATLRLFIEHPEVFAFEKLWYESSAEMHQLIRDTIKGVRPTARVGRHIDQGELTWDPLFRAMMPYSRIAKHADFVKLSTYHDIAGPRARKSAVQLPKQTFLADLPNEQILELFYAIVGYDKTKEPRVEELNEKGLSPEYVYRETRRAIEGLDGAKVAVYPAVAFDIPKSGANWGSEPWPSDPEKVYQATRRAFDAGADGIVICREYEELGMAGLKAVGRAVREQKAKG